MNKSEASAKDKLYRLTNFKGDKPSIIDASLVCVCACIHVCAHASIAKCDQVCWKSFAVKWAHYSFKTLTYIV